MNVHADSHYQSSLEMKRRYADACIGGALNSCIFWAKSELENRARKRQKRLEDMRQAKKRLVVGAAEKPTKAKSKNKAIVVIADDVHVARMRDIAQSISDIPRTGDISGRITIFLNKVRNLKASDFYALNDHSSAAAFDVADEILPFAEKLKCQLHIALSYPDKAAVQATKIENRVKTLA